MPKDRKDHTQHTDELAQAHAVLEAEAQAIRTIRLNNDFLRAVDILESCTGKVILTGMGKVGLIACVFPGKCFRPPCPLATLRTTNKISSCSSGLGSRFHENPGWRKQGTSPPPANC